MKKISFEEFLCEKCPNENHTNNDPAGFERWLENLDTAEVMEFAEQYGEEMYERGRVTEGLITTI